jgi:AhpD family alkylhydroperoxidase
MSKAQTITNYAYLTDKTESAVQVRINYNETSPGLLKQFASFLRATRSCSIEEAIRDLVAIRASQMNGCSFCSEMCFRQAKIHGENDLRLYELANWRVSTLFVSRERAALAWTEVLTKLPPGGVPDELYERVRRQLTEREISDLTFVVMVVNSLNRLTLGFKTRSVELHSFRSLSNQEPIDSEESQFDGWPI